MTDPPSGNVKAGERLTITGAVKTVIGYSKEKSTKFPVTDIPALPGSKALVLGRTSSTVTASCLVTAMTTDILPCATFAAMISAELGTVSVKARSTTASVIRAGCSVLIAISS